jgi:hypothetical protein
MEQVSGDSYLDVAELSRLHREHLGLVRESKLGPFERRRGFLQD